MPTKLFFDLSHEKQRKVIHVGISEFAAHGYTNSSTNRIVKNCGISKGSLFKYFSGKEDLYFFILDTVTEEFTVSMGDKVSDTSSEVFRRVIEYSALEFSWYCANPEKAKLIIHAFTKNNTEIYQKTLERYIHKQVNIWDSLIAGINTSDFACDKQKTVNILKWLLKGFNEHYLDQIQSDSHSYEYLENDYIKELTGYLEVLKTGLLK